MQYYELPPDSIFSFAHDREAGFNWLKIDNTHFMDLTDRTTISWDDDVFVGIRDRVEVEAWDPNVMDAIEEAFDLDDDDEITLVESDYFPDYELVVSYGDDILSKFTIHCWRNDEVDEDMHLATLWFGGSHVMDSRRWIVEDIMNLGIEPLEALFGPIRD